MKTLEDLKREIADQKKAVEAARKVTAKYKAEGGDRHQKAQQNQKAAETQLKFLQELEPYVRSNPDPEFLVGQLTRLRKLVEDCALRYNEHYPNLHDPKHRADFEKENRLPAIKKQISNLLYILQ